MLEKELSECRLNFDRMKRKAIKNYQQMRDTLKEELEEKESLLTKSEKECDDNEKIIQSFSRLIDSLTKSINEKESVIKKLREDIQYRRYHQ
jgi:hypothetical protein